MTRIAPATQKYRIQSIDILRGLIMLIMAIDHSRDFFHLFSPNPTDLATTTPALFFTRWITHFCAALFVFLSGVSINISGTRRTKRQLSMFLLKRGLWLIAVEFILITFVITLDPLYHMLIFQVIWVIGVSMIILALLIWLPLPAITVIGVLLFFGHDLLNHVSLPKVGLAADMWKVFFTAFAAFIQLDGGYSLLILYAILPWTGVMLMGYVAGQLFSPSYESKKRKTVLLSSGLGLVILFLVFRFFNIYGDPAPWKVQQTISLSVISFFNVSKYPPSLMYCCMTIGPGLILLSLIEKSSNAFTRVITVYGSVPFFYYILHFYLLRTLNIILFFIQGYGYGDILTDKSIMAFHPRDFGFSLLGVYGIWLLVIVMLYFPCKWFSKYKKDNQHWWLSYL